MTRKEITISWDNRVTEAFELLKQKLCTAPILVQPNFSKPFILYMDISKLGLDAILLQINDDKKEHIICYTSKGLHVSEENYDTMKLECLAIYWTIKYFRQYLYGKYFKLVMDHNALIRLFNSPQPSGLMARWITFLSEFDFEPIYCPGRVNKNADFLSR